MATVKWRKEIGLRGIKQFCSEWEHWHLQKECHNWNMSMYLM